MDRLSRAHGFRILSLKHDLARQANLVTGRFKGLLHAPALSRRHQHSSIESRYRRSKGPVESTSTDIRSTISFRASHSSVPLRDAGDSSSYLLYVVHFSLGLRGVTAHKCYNEDRGRFKPAVLIAWRPLLRAAADLRQHCLRSRPLGPQAVSYSTYACERTSTAGL